MNAVTPRGATLTAGDLLREFNRARKRCDAAALHLALTCPPRKCRYCGNHWIRWVGSKLEGHAKCIVDASFKHFVSIYLSDATVTVDYVSRLLGVTTSVVRGWVR